MGARADSGARPSGCAGALGDPDVEARRRHAFGMRGRALEHRGVAWVREGADLLHLAVFDRSVLQKFELKFSIV
jgi:hypothetical protein